MKYVVHTKADVQAGLKLDANGGPGRLFGWVVENYRPEGFYVDPTQRQAWVVVEINDPVKLTELMLVVSRNLGAQPTITPVFDAKDMGSIAQKAIENTRNAP